jgi:hypothetical protein
MADNNRPLGNGKVAPEAGKDSKIDFDDRSEENNFAGWPKQTQKGAWYFNGTLPGGRRFMFFMNAKDGWKITRDDVDPNEPGW